MVAGKQAPFYQMIVVVDSNILFSACISAERENRISEVLFNRLPYLQRISCYYAIAELFKHQEKLKKASKLSADNLSSLLYAIFKQVEFYNEDTIDQINWLETDRLTKEVDSKDITFVALALQTGGLLWTGEKKLANHLKTFGFESVVNTAELYELLNLH